MKGFLKGLLKLVFIVAYIGIGMKLQTDWEEMWDYFIVNPVLNAVADLAFFAVLLLGFIVLWVLFFVDTKKKKSSTTQSRRPAQAQTTRPATTHTAAARPVQTQTARPAATQPRPAQTQAAKPAAQSTTQSKKVCKDSLIFQDFFTAIPGALKGLVIGFALFFVFGLLNDLGSGSSLWSSLAVLSLFGCIIIFYIKSLKKQPSERIRRENKRIYEQQLRSNIENSLRKSMSVLKTVPPQGEENIRRYAEACEEIIYFISKYELHPRYGGIVTPYRAELYNRTWPVYKWNSRTAKYEYVPGIELTDVLQEEREKIEKELQEERERKMRNIK